MRLKGVEPGERVQRDGGVLKLDQEEVLLGLDGLEVGRQLGRRQHAQSELGGIQLEGLKEVALGFLLDGDGPEKQEGQ